MTAAIAAETSLAEQLREKLVLRTAQIGVVGLGYVGLPLAASFVASGYRVVGFDIDPSKVEKLQRGESYIGHIPHQLVQEMVQSSQFESTTAFRHFADVDAIVICVPTPLNQYREPDLSFIASTGEAIRRYLRPGQLIVLESTTYPGTTEDLLRPILEESELTAGKDYFLAYSPEREDPGNRQHSTASSPKVVGGVNLTSRDLAAVLYQSVAAAVVPVSSTQVAEACKILENTYRAINIALVNEMKVLFNAMGIDIWEVIAAAKTKPFGFQAFYPGPGLGGHCIPIDPFYLTWVARKFGQHTRFIELAGEINTSMPGYVVQRIAAALNDDGKPLKGSKVAVLGVAYKKDVDDPRESPAFAILEMLQSHAAVVSYNDPHIPALPPMRHHSIRMNSEALTGDFLRAQDCVVIVTDHSAYDFPWIARNCRLIVDTRNATAQCADGTARIWKA